MLSKQVKDGKAVPFIKADNGPDWSRFIVTNERYFSKLWRGSGLDILGIVRYVTQESTYSNGHLWTPQGQISSSVILPLLSEGDKGKVPYLQKELTIEEIRQNKAVVFEQAMNLIRYKWKHLMEVKF